MKKIKFQLLFKAKKKKKKKAEPESNCEEKSDRYTEDGKHSTQLACKLQK